MTGSGPVSINITAPTGSIAHWAVLTTGFRKIYENKEPIPGNHGTVIWNLADSGGHPVSNGLYYVRVEVVGINFGSKIFKLLILR